jgi:hypothetical protein
MAVDSLVRAWICDVVIQKMDVAALPVGTIHGQTLKSLQVSMVRSITASSELTGAPQAMVALHLRLLVVDSKLIWSHCVSP